MSSLFSGSIFKANAFWIAFRAFLWKQKISFYESNSFFEFHPVLLFTCFNNSKLWKTFFLSCTNIKSSVLKMYEIRVNNSKKWLELWLQYWLESTQPTKSKKIHCTWHYTGKCVCLCVCGCMCVCEREASVGPDTLWKSIQSVQVSVGHAKQVQHTSIHADNHAHI